MGDNVIALGRGITRVSQSGRLRPDLHVVPGTGNRPVLLIEGESIDLDLRGSVLSGAAVEGTSQDAYEGVGILVRNARDVTIRNAKVHGYRFNLRAEGCDQLRLVDCDFSDSRADRLKSEDQVHDLWLEIRDLAYWRSTGAGVWLESCNGAFVSGLRANHAQNGLVMVGCQNCELLDNDFGFNSGWGIALWGSSRNVIAWNLIDFVNRPWRGGWGGDSAALAMVGDCHQNFVVANSMTHGGDGLFLTDRTNGGPAPQGACDDNIFAFNDASFSTNNAFESTFSARNVFYRNYANDSRFGFWLGFSNDSWVLENEISRNSEYGIAIEHGRGNQISQNTMLANGRAAVKLWTPRKELLRSHPSTDIVLANNAIRNSPSAVFVEGTTDVMFHENECLDAPWPEGLVSSKAVNRPEAEQARYDQDGWFLKVIGLLKRRPSDFHGYSGLPLPTGWQWIECDTFAPLDFRNEALIWRRSGKRCAELFLTGASLARYSIHASRTVLMEAPVLGRPFRACAQGKRRGTITVRHRGESLRIEL